MNKTEITTKKSYKKPMLVGKIPQGNVFVFPSGVGG